MEVSVQLHARPLYPVEAIAGVQYVGGPVGPTGGMDDFERVNISASAMIRTPGCCSPWPSHCSSLSLYLLLSYIYHRRTDRLTEFPFCLAHVPQHFAIRHTN